MDSLYMPHYVTETWIPDAGSGIPRRDKAEGPFQAYVPDHLASKAWTFSPELTSRAARIEREILRLNRHAASGQLESVARLLMRSEAISSSRIEGIAPNADAVVLAELAQEEEVRGYKEGTEEVARNLTVLRSIEKSFATEPTISVELLEKLQRELMGRRAPFPLDFALFKTGSEEATTHPLAPNSSQHLHAWSVTSLKTCIFT